MQASAKKWCSRQQALRRRKPSAAGSGGSGAAVPDYCAEVSEVRKQLMAALNIDTVFARGRKPSAGEGRAQREAGVRGRQPPTLPNQATTEPSPSQEKPSAAASGVMRSVQRSTASAATTRIASGGVRACICFQRSAYTARSATQRAALHSAQRCTAPSATQRPALHCAQCFTAHSVTQCAAF